MTEFLNDCTGVILAGGENKRMPVLKSFITVEGHRIIEKNLKIMKLLFKDNFIVTNQPEYYTYLETPLFGDVYDTRGPMTGIFTALLNSSSQWVFISACDMPFISEDIIRFMASKRDNHDAVVPMSKGKSEPLFAFYSKRYMTLMEKSILSGEKSLREFLHNYKKGVQYISSRDIKKIENSKSSFINLNTPADIDAYLRPEDIIEFKKDSK
jgi:molybdopterin-guanine dinucleotide biosynthesis protein A